MDNGLNQSQINPNLPNNQSQDPNFRVQPNHNVGTNMGQAGSQQLIWNNTNQYAQSIGDKDQKTKERLCIVGFCISIISMLVAPFALPILPIMLAIGCAVESLKTRRRGLAIATIVLSILAIVVWLVFWLIALAINGSGKDLYR